MTDQDKNLDTFETSGTSPPAALAAAQSDGKDNEAARKHNYVREGFQNRTRGEKKFNVTTYFGLGYVGVWAFSLFASWALRDSKLLAPHYERGVQGLTRAVASMSGKEVAQVAPAVRKYANISSLFAGGTAVSVLPIKYREDHKYEIVKKYDEEIYGKDRVENDPTIKAAHADIQNAPKQTWSSVFASRLTSFIVTYAAAQVVGNKIEKHSTQLGRAFNRRVTKSPEVQAQIARAEAAPGQQFALGAIPGDPNADTITTRVAHDAVADGMYTVMTSGALYVFTRIFAPLFDRHPQHDKERPTTEQPLSAPLQTPTALEPLTSPLHHQRSQPTAQVNVAQVQSRVSAPAPELAHGA